MVVGGEVTYCELAKRAKRLAATIQTGRAEWREGVPLTAVFAYRSETAYAVILGALMAAARRRTRTFSLPRALWRGAASPSRTGMASEARAFLGFISDHRQIFHRILRRIRAR